MVDIHMFKKNENVDGYELARYGDLSTFLDIICEQYKVYSCFMSKPHDINSLETEDLIRLNRNQIDPLYISTIFSAMFLEAYIYDYGARKSSASYIKNYIDKIDAVSKWVIVTRLFNKEGIDCSSNVFSNIKKLFDFRNKLAHSKSNEFTDLDTITNSAKNHNVLNPSECIDYIISVMNELLRIDSEELYASMVLDKLKKLKVQYLIPTTPVRLQNSISNPDN